MSAKLRLTTLTRRFIDVASVLPGSIVEFLSTRLAGVSKFLSRVSTLMRDINHNDTAILSIRLVCPSCLSVCHVPVFYRNDPVLS